MGNGAESCSKVVEYGENHILYASARHSIMFAVAVRKPLYKIDYRVRDFAVLHSRIMITREIVNDLVRAEGIPRKNDMPIAAPLGTISLAAWRHSAA